jgi:hypothetical protein
MAKNKSTTHDWILLVHQLPTKPTNLRVRIWRKLQKLGAVSLKNSVYVLPNNDKTYEDFQWLKQEIESAGGAATVLRAGSVEGATDKELIDAFQTARNGEFGVIASQFDRLRKIVQEQMKTKRLSPTRLATHETELDKFHVELQRIIANDFFKAKGGTAAVEAYERAQKAIRFSQSPSNPRSSGPSKAGVLAVGDYQGRRWFTRRNMHIDRLASAWLIKEFIDKRPRFYFVSEGETVENAISFDMFDAEFTHHGDDCTFETMLKRFGLQEVTGLRALSEIVHDIDLKDDKFNRLEAAGLNAVITGMSERVQDDRKLLQHAGVVFDGLFALLDKAKKSAAKKKR